jgi:hypothetical protein
VTVISDNRKDLIVGSTEVRVELVRTLSFPRCLEIFLLLFVVKLLIVRLKLFLELRMVYVLRNRSSFLLFGFLSLFGLKRNLSFRCRFNLL